MNPKQKRAQTGLGSVFGKLGFWLLSFSSSDFSWPRFRPYDRAREKPPHLLPHL